VGNGPLHKQVEKLALGDERILLPGKTDTPEEWYAAADLMLLPSLYEPFGQVLLEAMGSGCPPVAFIPTVPEVLTASDEIVENDKTGFFVPPGRFDLMVEKMFELALTPQAVVDVGDNAISIINTRYSWARHCSNLMELCCTKQEA
jgi:glycosyltransferase involved in cell wall biosynthesis